MSRWWPRARKLSTALPMGPWKGPGWVFEHSTYITDMYWARLTVIMAAGALLLTSASVGWRARRPHKYQPWGVLKTRTPALAWSE